MSVHDVGSPGSPQGSVGLPDSKAPGWSEARLGGGAGAEAQAEMRVHESW